MKVLFLFIDGVGLRAAATDNPVNPEVCPALCRLITKHGKPIDARLGIDGPPQSATGQATMFAGVNCAAAMGKHCEGFPGPNLRKIIETDNLFKQLRSRGKEVCFSDAYLVDAAASAFVESLVDHIEETIPEKTRPRFAPGYGDFSIEMQEDLLRYMRADNIGMGLTEMKLMIPQKSVTCVIGVTDED